MLADSNNKTEDPGKKFTLRLLDFGGREEPKTPKNDKMGQSHPKFLMEHASPL